MNPTLEQKPIVITGSQRMRLLHAYETLQIRLTLMDSGLSQAERDIHYAAWRDVRDILLGDDKGICDIHGGEWPGYGDPDLSHSWEALK